MEKGNKKFLKIALIVLLGGGIIWWIVKHNTFTEGLTHRLTTTSELAPLIYSTSMVNSPYYQKWNYDVASPMIEGYSDMYACEKACQNVLGDTPHQDCIENCQNETLYNNQTPNPMSCGS